MNHFKLVQCDKDSLKNKMHDIREKILFPDGKYDRNHVDDNNLKNRCFIYLLNDKAVGTVRLDFISNDVAAVRLVAILEEYQGQKIGAKMLNEVEEYARNEGIAKLVTNAVINAVGFYKSIGYTHEAWVDPGEGISRQTTPMTKKLK